jgi:hypothetical protein
MAGSTIIEKKRVTERLIRMPSTNHKAIRGVKQIPRRFLELGRRLVVLPLRPSLA